VAEKYKILLLSDHLLSTSGVGTQSRWVVNGLVATGKYKFLQLGAAVKHANYDVVKVSDDIVIKPIDGFGDKEMLRVILATERPDAVFLFTDPRFFIWLWEIEDELHQVCPIVYWKVWDERPTPAFNKVLYDSTDLINCHSYLTYEMLSELLPDRVHDGTLNFIPHALPQDVFKPIDPSKRPQLRSSVLSPAHADNFVAIWVNRNAKRKRANDVLESWRLFLDALEAKHGHRKATLIMHTDPLDSQGSNLLKTSEMLGVQRDVFFSKERLSFEQMAVLYNISDCCLNTAANEGFGLSTLEAMQCGVPIIALKTGGLTRQVVDHRDGSENGIALDVELRTLVGSLLVPYIYECYCSNQSTADALLQMYEWGPEKRRTVGQKARDYVLSEFDISKTVADWDRTLSQTIETWRNDRKKLYQPWEVTEL